MKKKVFNLIVLDESGSMSMIEKSTISGLNETIQTIKTAQKKHEDQEHFLSLMSFNSEGRKYHYECTPVNDITLFDGKDYQPSSCTPLYDAIGAAIAKLRRQSSEDDMVLMTIITDGMENDSKEYDHRSLTRLMDKMKARGWVVTYIGANQDAVKMAEELHIDNGLEYDATPEGVESMLELERESRANLYACVCECESPLMLKQRIGKSFFKKKLK